MQQSPNDFPSVFVGSESREFGGKLRASERLGSYSIVAAALVAAVSFTAGAAAPAVAAQRNPGLHELWKQFPLDTARNVPATRNRPPDAEQADPARRVRPTTFRPPAEARSAWYAFAGLGIALLGAVGVGTYAARRRLLHLQMPARPFRGSWRLPRGVAAAAGERIGKARLTFPRLTPLPAGIRVAHPLPTARSVTENLVRAVSAFPPGHDPTEAKAPRAKPGDVVPKSKTGTQTETDWFTASEVKSSHDGAKKVLAASDAVVLKEKLAIPQKQKHGAKLHADAPQLATAQAHADALKRKPQEDYTELFNAKRQGERALDKKRLVAGETTILREKRQSTREPKRGMLRREYSRSRAGAEPAVAARERLTPAPVRSRTMWRVAFGVLGAATGGALGVTVLLRLWS